MKDFIIALRGAHKGQAFDVIGGGKRVLEWKPTDGRLSIAMNRACILPACEGKRHFYDYEVLYDRTVSSSEWYRYGMAKRVLMAYRIINPETYDPAKWEAVGCELYGYHCDAYPIKAHHAKRWVWLNQIMTLISSGGIAMHAAIIMGASDVYLWGCTWTGKDKAHWGGGEADHNFKRSGEYILKLAHYATRVLGVKLHAQAPNILLDEGLADEI